MQNGGVLAPSRGMCRAQTVIFVGGRSSLGAWGPVVDNSDILVS